MATSCTPFPSRSPSEASEAPSSASGPTDAASALARGATADAVDASSDKRTSIGSAGFARTSTYATCGAYAERMWRDGRRKREREEVGDAVFGAPGSRTEPPASRRTADAILVEFQRGLAVVRPADDNPLRRVRVDRLAIVVAKARACAISPATRSRHEQGGLRSKLTLRSRRDQHRMRLPSLRHRRTPTTAPADRFTSRHQPVGIRRRAASWKAAHVSAGRSLAQLCHIRPPPGCGN